MRIYIFWLSTRVSFVFDLGLLRVQMSWYRRYVMKRPLVGRLPLQVFLSFPWLRGSRREGTYLTGKCSSSNPLGNWAIHGFHCHATKNKSRTIQWIKSRNCVGDREKDAWVSARVPRIEIFVEMFCANLCFAQIYWEWSRHVGGVCYLGDWLSKLNHQTFTQARFLTP